MFDKILNQLFLHLKESCKGFQMIPKHLRKGSRIKVTIKVSKKQDGGEREGRGWVILGRGFSIRFS